MVTGWAWWGGRAARAAARGERHFCGVVGGEEGVAGSGEGMMERGT